MIIFRKGPQGFCGNHSTLVLCKSSHRFCDELRPQNFIYRNRLQLDLAPCSQSAESLGCL